MMPQFDEIVGRELLHGTYSWDSDRALLYAVGIGAGCEDPYGELQFTTENTEGVPQQVVPSFLTQMYPGGDWIKQLGFKAREWNGIDWGYPEGLVHGEQGFTLHRPIPVSGTAELTLTVTGVYDKGKGALAIAETRAVLADTGEPLGSMRSGMFIRDQGGFGGPRSPADEQPWVKLERDVDMIVPLVVPVGQALIFRLNGDRNPHGTDPARARADGFEKPIFFGLGTYGFACRALLKGLCEGDAARFGGMEGRFSQPVYPGDRLDTAIWLTDGGAQFQTWANGERLVIDRGLFRFMGA